MTDKTPYLRNIPELQADGKLTPSVLYTTEAEESKKKTEAELNIPDPDKEDGERIIAENSAKEKEN
tara:strand:- start:149 stop:346 length:198 start_codon:yes stop_codon:yes gene_type:complete